MNQSGPDGATVGSQRIGEVVESASHRFTAQCYRLYGSPPLGAFIRTRSGIAIGPGIMSEEGSCHVYAVVYGVMTQSLDPGRPVIARGEDEAREEDVYRSNPQLTRLLCTRFEALIVGHSDGTGFNHYLPAMPPQIHAFVYQCTPEEVEGFTRSLDFLNLLLNSSPAGRGVTDEVIAACLRQASAHLEQPRSFLVRAGKALAVQLSGDMPHLSSILRRLSP